MLNELLSILKRYWLVAVGAVLGLYVYYLFAYDVELMKDLMVRKATIAFWAVGLGYCIRKLAVGKIVWEGNWRVVYALVMQAIVGLAVIFG